MTRNTHRLIGVVELTPGSEFEPLEFLQDQPSLPFAMLEDATRSGVLPEAPLRADLSHLCCELDREYRQFVGTERNSELAVL